MRSFLERAKSSLGRDPVWGFLIGLGGLMAFVGPFGTFEAFSFPVRLAYWVPLILLSNVIVRISQRIVDERIPDVPGLVGQLIGISIFTLLFGPTVWLYSGLFSSQMQTLQGLVQIVVYVFGVSVAVGLLVFFMTREATVDGQPVIPRLQQRLPADATSPIVRLTVDDHYVEVHLKDGTNHRVLMRLSDAVAEMDEIAGFYTHRSHWVAMAYVVESMREKNREYLMLETGARVPVSKTYREAVLAAGFLK